jgi:hypothetical protein
MDTDMIEVFIFSMTNEALIHELECSKPRTTRELLNLATSHASGEETVQAIFYKYKGKAQAEPMDMAKEYNRWGKGKKDSWRHHDSEFVVAIDRVHRQKTGKLNQVSFDKIVKLSCHNHGYLVKHTLKECDLISATSRATTRQPAWTHCLDPLAMMRRGMCIQTRMGAS